MHHVNPKRRRAQILRVIAYTLTLTLSVITTVVLLYVALGYRLDGSSGHVVQSGLLLVDTKPVAGALYINNELKDQQAPGRFVLSAGQYDLAIKQTGYRDWAKQVTVKASGVREVNYTILIPNTITPRSLLEMPSASLVSQSQDRKLLLTYESGAPQLQLIELDPKQPKQTALALSSAFSRESGQFGTIAIIEWALNNKQVLLSHTLPSGSVEYISLDVTKPEEAINITKLYPGEALQDIHYVGGDTKHIYGVSGGVLRRHALASAETEVVLQSVQTYRPYSDDTILFTRVTANNLLEVGIMKDSETTIIENQLDPAEVPLLAYAEYDDHFYFVIARGVANLVTIYRDPLKKPVLAKQLPFVKFAFTGAQKVRFSDSARFVLVQNGNTFTTYDLEDTKLFSVEPAFKLAAGSTFEWIDGFHISAVSEDGTSHLLEYDGKNEQSLLAVRAGTKLYFAPNFQYVYRFTGEQRMQLETASMVVGRE